MAENEISSPEDETQKIKEHLYLQFDQENQALGEALGMDSDLYKNQKEKFVEQQLENQRLQRENSQLKEEKENISQDLEKAKERIKKLMFDSVTGFSKRERLYLKLEEELPELLGTNIEDLESEELSRLFKEKSKELKNTPLSVMMSDVSFLSLANEKGHASGDALLRLIGKAGKEVGSPSAEKYKEDGRYDFEAQRHGGDEMTAIIRLNLQDAQKKALEFKLKVSKQEIAQTLYGLQPNIDTGVAHISEALEALKKLNEDEMIGKGDRTRLLLDTWVAIADRRSAVQKGQTRLKELKNLRIKQPELYPRLISYLRKGAYNTSDKELDDLITRENAGENWEEISKSHIKEKQELIFEQEEETEKKRREIINSIADRVFE